jgi:hypothetical protein
MLNAVMLSVVKLNVIIMSVIMLSVVAPLNYGLTMTYEPTDSCKLHCKMFYRTSPRCLVIFLSLIMKIRNEHWNKK